MTDSQATTTLPPQYRPDGVEGPRYRQWLADGPFHARRDSDRTPYVIMMPPPNVTAVLHMGQGLNNTLQDVLIRFERMRGREALWLPGTDHAGIATQNVVERLLAQEGLTRFDLGREKFVERVWAYVNETGQTILDQLKAIGASCDWERTRFTLDPDYSRAVRHTFVTLWEEGLIYRGHRVIHWCSRCLTALSDEEAEFHDSEGKLYHIRYPVVGQPDRWITVATTRPETMLGDTAVAADPHHEPTAWAIGERVRLPLTDIELPVVGDDVVDPEFGTGFVKVTPAHDAVDFEIGERHGLSMPLIMDPEGRMTDPGDPAGTRVPADLVGVDRDEARKRIVERLEAEGLLEKTERHAHAVRKCYRCGTVVEPRLSEQWFVRMEPLARPALDAYRAGGLTFVPERWGGVYENWLAGIRDWNISRQLWWGHRIPVFRCADCNEEWADREDPTACRACGGTNLEQDPDVLDTWFSSWLWPFATLGWPDETPDLARFYPGHTLVTASEIIFFWVARMVMAGYHFLGERPFETVCITGTVRDTQHRKMSKSLGNGIDPLAVVDAFGADALRYTVIGGAAVGTDVIMDPADLEATFAPGRNFCNKLWNIGRFVLSNLEEDGQGRRETVEDGEGREEDRGDALADRWILSRLEATTAEVTEAFERFRLNDAANAAYRFAWNELADWYLEAVKPRLRGDAPGGDRAREVLRLAFERSLSLLHPVVPFITEALWQRLPDREGESLVTAHWPAIDEARLDAEAERGFGAVQQVVNAIRSIRADYGVPRRAPLVAHVQDADEATRATLTAERSTIGVLAGVSDLSFDAPPPGPGASAVLHGATTVFVPLGEAVDVERECTRLRAERDRLRELLQQVEAKLANERFTSRAPVEVVERERAKAQSWSEQCEALDAKLAALGCR